MLRLLTSLVTRPLDECTASALKPAAWRAGGESAAVAVLILRKDACQATGGCSTVLCWLVSLTSLGPSEALLSAKIDNGRSR